MEPVTFTASVRYWNEEQQSGLAEFTSNVMPAGAGRLAMSVSKALQKAAGVGIGGAVRVTITGVGKE